MYEPNAFKATLHSRLSGHNKVTSVPFDVPRKTKHLVRDRIANAAGGLSPVDILVSLLTEPEPLGLGIKYDWTVSANARQALELRRGDCVSLAMLLVGLGRSLNWPIYFAEARPQKPVSHELSELTVLSSHMIVIVLTQEGPVFVDFLGLIDQSEYEIHPIDDLSAYGHLVNNTAAHRVANAPSGDLEAWNAAKDEFLTVTKIQPTLGHGWNNLGIAYARLEQFKNARFAYNKAIELDPAFGASSRNLTIMETRASAKTSIVRRDLVSP